MSPTTRHVAFCPHCGNTSPQELHGVSASDHGADGWHNYYLTKCLTCGRGLLYRQIADMVTMPMLGGSISQLDKCTLLWPAVVDLHESVPESVRLIYKEAASIKNRAPNAFSNQIRRCLEAVCRNRGTSKGSLAHNLEELVTRGEIGPVLADMTDVLRRLGNIGSHDSDEVIAPEYVDVIDEFFRAVVEYVYIAPFKVGEFKKRLASVNNAAQP